LSHVIAREREKEREMPSGGSSEQKKLNKNVPWVCMKMRKK
jgi:hypothetical protein